MRITSSMYYKGIYGEENSKLSNKLFDVNKQIASGLKIQYASDDIRTFTETMRLDNEIVVLGQVKNSTESGSKFSNQSDAVLNEFNSSMNRTRTLLVQAANGTNDDVSLDAIAEELRAIENNFKNLANTSINGQYLFSGSAVDTRPITEDGEYVGNDGSMNAFTGSRTSQKYNISGQELFLGEDSSNQRTVTTNVVESSNVGTTLDGSTTMADFNGTLPGANQHHFYLRGTKSDGTSFKADIALDNNSTINDLLDAIGTQYGNAATDVVDVTMNDRGQIEIKDKISGSSKLDFHMIGASDFNASDNLNPPITDIDVLDSETTDYATASAGAGDIFVREFMQSGLTSATGAATNIEGIVYDRANFSKDGSYLTSSMPQVLKTYNTSVDPHVELDQNAFATPSTKLSDVANAKVEILPATTPKTYTLDSTQLLLSGDDINGVAFTAQIDLALAPSTVATFSLDGGTTNYDIFNVDGTNVNPDEMTYQQLMDVVNMVTTGEIPVANTATDYHVAVESSAVFAKTSLTHDGKLEFKDFTSTSTKANIALYDANSEDFSADASVMTFNTNNALTVRDPKTDFFKELDEIIKAVENYKSYPDSSAGDARNIGIQNAIVKMDDLMDHVSRSHSIVGAQSNALTTSLERTSILEISSMSLRSAVIDTDLAEASLTLTQLQINYEAMLSTVGKVSQLSLVNYL